MQDHSYEIVKLVQSALGEQADPVKAPQMAAYMKTDMPFYGVQKPERIPIIREIKRLYPPDSRAAYEKVILALWNLPHREEKYLSIDYACKFVSHADEKTLKLFEQLVREGAWWDFVDPIASQLVGSLLMKYRKSVARKLNRFIEDDDFWIRRTAILSQLKHKQKTDERMLFSYCQKSMHEKEFFIRKAIGWALREYSYTAPDQVKRFLLTNKQSLSSLTYREAGKYLIKQGLLSI